MGKVRATIKPFYKFFKKAKENVSFFLIEHYRKILKFFTWRAKLEALKKSKEGIKLHLGCGEQHLDGYMNCEFRATKAADIVMDCGNLSLFPDNSIKMIYSHAFFEHLYRYQHDKMLSDCFRVLNENGKLIFLGLPDFEIIAKAYCNKEKGIVGKVFDLYNVYRYTHGDPEIAMDYWQEQLHKSLLDKSYMINLCKKAGFGTIITFNYCYPKEDIPLCMGILAYKKKIVDINLDEILVEFKNRINIEKGVLNINSQCF